MRKKEFKPILWTGREMQDRLNAMDTALGYHTRLMVMDAPNLKDVFHVDTAHRVMRYNLKLWQVPEVTIEEYFGNGWLMQAYALQMAFERIMDPKDAFQIITRKLGFRYDYDEMQNYRHAVRRRVCPNGRYQFASIPVYGIQIKPMSEVLCMPPGNVCNSVIFCLSEKENPKHIEKISNCLILQLEAPTHPGELYMLPSKCMERIIEFVGSLGQTIPLIISDDCSNTCASAVAASICRYYGVQEAEFWVHQMLPDQTIYATACEMLGVPIAEEEVLRRKELHARFRC